MAIYTGYHGTPKKFNTLQARGTAYAYMGKGIYFTSELDEAIGYANPNHPDHKNTINDRFDYFCGKIESDSRAISLARRPFLNPPRVFSCQFEIRKPLIINPYKHNWVSGPIGRLWKLKESRQVDEYRTGAWDTLIDSFREGVETKRLKEILNNFDMRYQHKMLRCMGFDGVIMHDPSYWWRWCDYTGTHYTIFQRKQLKSAIWGHVDALLNK